MRGSSRAVISGAIVAAMGAMLIPTPAAAVEGNLSPPDIVSVVPGSSSTSLDVAYSTATQDSVQGAEPISHQISLDMVNWFNCPPIAAEEPTGSEPVVTGSCPLSGLAPLRTYGIYMRSAVGLQASGVVGPIVATTPTASWY